MKLADWRSAKGWTQSRLAEELGCDISTVARWENGTRDPSRADKRRIFLLSEGAVEPNDFYDLPIWRRALDAVLDRLSGMAA